MVAKNKLKYKNGFSVPIVIFVLLGLSIGMAIISRINLTSDSILKSHVEKNKILSHDTTEISRAIEWLELNKDNLNNDIVGAKILNSVALNYYSSGKISALSTNNLSVGVFNVYEDTFLYPSSVNSTSSAKPLLYGFKNNSGFSSQISIFRMCSVPNVAPNEVVNGVTNECMKDQILMTPTSSNNSSAGYGGYDYTVSPASDKIIYLIKVQSTVERAGSWESHSDSEMRNDTSLITETMVSM